MTNLAVADLDLGLQDDRYLGFGYLGERRTFFGNYGMSVAPQIEAADAFILECANREGWTVDDLFAWANSKDGRWAGEILLSGNAPTFAGLNGEKAAQAAKYIHRSRA